MGRNATPEMPWAMAFLLSEEARFITGVTLPVTWRFRHCLTLCCAARSRRGCPHSGLYQILWTCLPLLNWADFYQFYYAHTPGAAPQFALGGAGRRNSCAAPVHSWPTRAKTPDIWVSVWVAAKGHNGAGLELMDALSGLLNARKGAAPATTSAPTPVLHHWPQAERLPHTARRTRCKGWQLAAGAGSTAPCRYRMTCR